MRLATIIHAGLFVLVLAAPARAQQQNYVADVSKRATTVAEFLQVGVGTRATAMGGAFVARADDPSAIYWNPAGLASIGRSAVYFDHTSWIAETTLNFFSGVYYLGGAGAVGLSVTAFSALNDEPVRTVDQPEGTGEVFSAGDFAFSLAYSRQLTDRFSIGLSPKVIRQHISDMSAVGFAMDAGILYRTPFDGIMLGMSISNFGTDMSMGGEDALVLHDPDPEGTGNNSRIPANLRTDRWPLPLTFRVGLSYDLIDTHRQSVIVAVDALVPNNNYQSMNAGVEYRLFDTFSLYGGYKSLFLPDSEESFTLGAGLEQALLGNMLLRAGFSYASFGRLKDVTKITLGMDF